MLVINGKDIDSTVGKIMRRHRINQERFDSIASGVFTWAKKLFAFMTMSGFVANLQDALTRVIVCLIPINRLTGYLSGIGATMTKYRKRLPTPDV